MPACSPPDSDETDTASQEGFTTRRSAGACLICGSTRYPTVEHIVPQALWHRFGIDPDREDLARYRTTLCSQHNRGTSVLHERTEMLDLIATDGPVNKRTLQHLADWAVWVTLLLGLARGEGVLGPDATRDLLRKRLDEDTGGIPRGFRVYAARVRTFSTSPQIDAEEHSQYSLALFGDDRIILDHRSQPIGYSARTGTVHAAEAIGLGRMALLVVGPTYASGRDHNNRLDHAATLVGVTRIHPLPAPAPHLNPLDVNMREISRLFTVMPHGSNMSLAPAVFRLLLPADPDG